MTDRDLMQRALEALEAAIDVPCYGGHPKQETAAAALQERLAQPEQDVPATCFGNMVPVGWLEPPDGVFRANPLYKIKFPSKLLSWQVPLYTALPQPEPVAKVELMLTGGAAGLATRIVEIDDHLRERLRPGQLLYTGPPQRNPLTDDEIEAALLSVDPMTKRLPPGMKAFARAIEAAHGIKGEA